MQVDYFVLAMTKNKNEMKLNSELKYWKYIGNLENATQLCSWFTMNKKKVYSSGRQGLISYQNV